MNFAICKWIHKEKLQNDVKLFSVLIYICLSLSLFFPLSPVTLSPASPGGPIGPEGPGYP